MNDERNARSEKQEASDINITASSPFMRWLDNFWYHHKWKVLIITFFAIVIIVGVVQMLNKEDPDSEITIATHTVYYKENVDAIDSALLQLMPGDRNGDGKKNVLTQYYKIYSEKEMTDANEAETDNKGDPVIYADKSYNDSQYSDFKSYINTGESSILLVSKYLYDELVLQNRVMPLSEIFDGQLPRGAMSDGYGVMLKNTYACEFFEAFDTLPDDTVVCLLRPYVWGSSSREEHYAYTVEYFKNIVAFGE
jgi:hypothetical protein